MHVKILNTILFEIESMPKEWSKWNKYLELHHHQNLAKMVLYSINRFGDKPVMRWFSHDLSTVHVKSYTQLGNDMRAVFGGLASLGLQKGDRIALCSETSCYWPICDLGVQARGGVLTAIYPNLKPAEVKYILNDSNSKAIFVDTQSNLEKVQSIEKDCSDLKYIFVIEQFDSKLKKQNVFSLEELMKKGEEYNNAQPTAFQESVDAVQETDIASLIYTSGTTGIPKGTILTHRNFLSDATAAVAVAATLRRHINPAKINFFTLLPMAHSFGRCVDEYCVLYGGAIMNFVGGYDPKRVRRAFEAFHPTAMVAIPYFFQKIYNIIMDEVDHMPPKIQKVFKKVVNNEKIYYTNRLKGIKNPFSVVRIHYTSSKLVGRVVRKKLGGQILLMISGSAAIAPDLVLFFLGMGINLVEGFGLTETSPVTHLLRTKNNSDFRPGFKKRVDVYRKLGSIGPTIAIENNPYPNCEQKLTEFGELLIRGPMVMPGYWNQPEETKMALDQDGWLHTGDLAEIDEDGYVKITGRAKVIIKLNTAKMISPIVIEQLIVPVSKVVAQIILVGDDTRKYITAIVVPYQKPLKEYADEHKIPYKTWSDIVHNKDIIRNTVKKEIDTLTKDCADFMVPKKIAISSAAFELKEGYLTPSYKFKRKKIFDDLKAEINALYDQEDDIYIIEKRMTDFYDQSMIVG